MRELLCRMTAGKEAFSSDAKRRSTKKSKKLKKGG